jgi:hypothetical protein
MPKTSSLLCAALTLVQLCIFSRSAYPWGAKGHEIVALIAEAHLSDQTRDKIKALLPEDETLAQSATWPDRVGRGIPDMNPYHSVDIQDGATSYNQARDCPERNCILGAIPWYVRVLTSSDAPRNERRIALRFLVHLVGDIHQPLHVGFKGDTGGIGIVVHFNGKELNLHRLWDSGILATEEETAAELATRFDKEFSPQEQESWKKGSAQEWAEESFALAVIYAYRVPQTHEIGPEYVSRTLPIIHKRLAQAGVRLAWLLNETLTTQSRGQ